MYRPEFAYPVAEPPCEDVRCSYSFDATNVPAIAAGIPGNWVQSNRIPLQLDQDAPFLLRGIQIAETVLRIGLVDSQNLPLVDPGQGPGFDNDGLPPALEAYVWGSTNGAGLVALDSDNWGVWFPPGAVLGLYVGNTSGGLENPPIITLHGVKRYSRSKCR